MRSRFVSHAIILTLVATLGLTGCKNFHWPWQKSHPSDQGGAPGEPPPLTGNGIENGTRPIVTGELPHGQFAPVYFDFDSARVKPSEVSKIEAVASWMKSNSSAKLVVEGHCDERGTAEYNRALGERRAGAAREELVRMGVEAERITTISYGKDRPADPGHDEASWAKNRRCEFSAIKE